MVEHPIEKHRVLIWDVPVRLFHWLLVLCFVVAYLTSESERWQLWHVTSGYVFGLLILFRLIWGVIGPRYARFKNFVKSPKVMMAYLTGLLKGQSTRHLGHNPAGAWAIVGMLGFGLLVVFSGWASFNDYGDWFEELHEVLANILLLIIAIHIGGVLVSSIVYRENLAKAMIHGYKVGASEDAIRYPQWIVAIVLLLGIGIFLWALLSSRLPLLLP